MFASQSRAVLSPEGRVPDPVSTRVPSGEKAAAFIWEVCPVRTWRHSPVAAFQILAVASLDALSIRSPSGENATQDTPSVCPEKALIRPPVAVSHRSTLRLVAPVSNRVPSCERAAI